MLRIRPKCHPRPLSGTFPEHIPDRIATFPEPIVWKRVVVGSLIFAPLPSHGPTPQKKNRREQYYAKKEVSAAEKDQKMKLLQSLWVIAPYGIIGGIASDISNNMGI